MNAATIDPIHHEVEYEELLCAINDVKSVGEVYREHHFVGARPVARHVLLQHMDYGFATQRAGNPYL